MSFEWLKKIFAKEQSPEATSNYSFKDAESEVEFVRKEYQDELTGTYISIELICTCGLPVARAEIEPHFYCLHCDRFCEVGILKCPQCAYAMMDRVDYDSEFEGEEDEF